MNQRKEIALKHRFLCSSLVKDNKQSFFVCSQRNLHKKLICLWLLQGKNTSHTKLNVIRCPQYWLDVEKPMCRQVGLSMLEPTLRFCVKFYTPDPARLEEEFTRYLFCLQVKRDLAMGCIQCNENTAALMASYIVQG